MVPRVAMKGGSLNWPTKKPLISPTTRQHSRVMRIASKGFTPATIRVAEVMALMPTTEPMDRSMLPVMRT